MQRVKPLMVICSVLHSKANKSFQGACYSDLRALKEYQRTELYVWKPLKIHAATGQWQSVRLTMERLDVRTTNNWVDCRSGPWARAFTSTALAKSNFQASACRQLSSPKSNFVLTNSLYFVAKCCCKKLFLVRGIVIRICTWIIAPHWQLNGDRISHGIFTSSITMQWCADHPSMLFTSMFQNNV